MTINRKPRVVYALALAISTLLLFACQVVDPSQSSSTTSTTVTTLPPDDDIVVQQTIAPFTSNIYVAGSGSDTTGDGSLANPYKTVSFAAKQATWGNVLKVAAGTYVESFAIELAPGVSLDGEGIGITIIKGSGIALPEGISTLQDDFIEWPWGSLIQLVSDSYQGGPLVRYGSPDQMATPVDGSQKVSNVTLDGNNKSVKAGLWAESRSNITIENVRFVKFEQRGLVITRGDIHYRVRLPEGKWVRNIIVKDCTFSDTTVDLGTSKENGNSTGALCIGGINGADISGLNISETKGYGIKFMHVGHYRNVKIHDVNIVTNEVDAIWDEDLSIELWNPSFGNEIYNVTANTAFSIVSQDNGYQPTEARPYNVKIHDSSIIDRNGNSIKETMEIAVSGIEIYNCYFQDKGFGLGIWGGLAWDSRNIYPVSKIYIHNNIFSNFDRSPARASNGQGAAVFMADQVTDIKIYNNVFNRMMDAVHTRSPSTTNVHIKNNIFLETQVDDVFAVVTFVNPGAGFSIANNLKYSATPSLNTFKVTSNLSGYVGAGNVGSLGAAPGLSGTDTNNWRNSFKPTSAASSAVNAGVDVAIPFLGAAPDIGWFEAY